MTQSSQRRSVWFRRLRWDWMRRRGDFIRPHGVPREEWRRQFAAIRAEAEQEPTHCDSAGRGYTA
jgi:hypothetical protein